MSGRKLLSIVVIAGVTLGVSAAAALAVNGAPGLPPSTPASPNTRCNFGDPTWYGFVSKQQCHAFFDAGGRIWSLQEDLRRSSTNPAPDSYRVAGVWAFRSKNADQDLPGELLTHNTQTGNGNQQWDTLTAGIDNNVPLVGVAGVNGSLAAAHPGFPGQSPTDAVVDWRATRTARYEVRLDLWIGDPVCSQTHSEADGIGWNLIAATGSEAVGLASGLLEPDSSDHDQQVVPVELKADDHVYLVVTPGDDPEDNISCDTMAMHVTVLQPGA
jgi:hypothetical protein